MKFTNRNGMLYISINGKRTSTKLKDTKANRKLFESYSKNDEFFKKFNVNQKVPTVLELCEDVLRDKEKYIKSTSLRSYISMYESNIVPFFKDRLITDIKPIDIKKWYGLFNDRSSISTCEAILKSAFDNAILSEYIKSTPFIIKKPKLESNYEMNPFTLNEVKLILSQDSLLKNFLGISFFTGLRTGELIGLKWSDIDFLNNKISVNRTITCGYIQTPKTKSSKAIIDLPIESLYYFDNQRKKTGFKEYLFYSDVKNPFSNSSKINSRFKTLLKSLNLDFRSVYQTRHTFASLKLSYGERLEWVSFMLRHKNSNITLQRYYKYVPSADVKRVVLDIDSVQKLHTC